MDQAIAGLAQSAQRLNVAAKGFAGRVESDRQAEVARLQAVLRDTSRPRLQRVFAAGILRRMGEAI